MHNAALLRSLAAAPLAIQSVALHSLMARLISMPGNQAADASQASAQAANQVELQFSAAGFLGEAAGVEPGQVSPQTAAAAPSGRRKGGTALIGINGPMVYRWGRAAYWYGCCNTDDITAAVNAAAADSDIANILLWVNSPGGMVTGTPELADAIFAARSSKRVIAFADPLAASAAYWAASQAHEVVVTPSGDVGSVGVFMLHLDWSKYLSEAGIQPTFIHAGEFKVEGNPYEPLTDEARARFQKECDAIYASFIAAIARGRAIKPAQVREGFGKGRTMMSAEAKTAGMVDRIAVLPDLLARLGVSATGVVGRPENAASASVELEQTASGSLLVRHAPEQARFSTDWLRQNDAEGSGAIRYADGMISIEAENMSLRYQVVAEDQERGTVLAHRSAMILHGEAEAAPDNQPTETQQAAIAQQAGATDPAPAASAQSHSVSALQREIDLLEA